MYVHVLYVLELKTNKQNSVCPPLWFLMGNTNNDIWYYIAMHIE